MNREIKFKAKITGTDVWIYGLPYTINLNNSIDSMIDFQTRAIEHIKTDTLSQFTGLFDKNNQEIYEGDLIRLLNNKNGEFKVEFKNDYVGGWVLTHHSTLNHISLGVRLKTELEVVGNIHQDHE